MTRYLKAASAAVAGLGVVAVAPGVFAQTQAPLTSSLCGYTVGGNFAGCSVAYVWNGTAWVLIPTGPGAATNAPRQVVAQDPTTLAGSSPGTAGTASPQVVTVQGISGGTPLSTNDTLASGAVSAGAFAPGAIGSGAFASGAVSAGAIVDLGTGATPAANTTNAYLQSLTGSLAAPGASAATPVGVQGVTGGKPVPVTASSGAIVDLGSGATPAANTTNAYLLSLTGSQAAPGSSASTPVGVQGVTGGKPMPVTAIPSTSTDRSGSTVSAVAGYTITAGGSGGTNGANFTLGVSGGTCTVAPAGVFTVSGGALTSISYTTQGICTVAPTLSFTASTGLTGAAAVATLDNLLTAMPANASRRSFYVFNPNQTATCWGRFTTDPVNFPAKPNAAGSFPLPISGGFGMEMNPNINALSVECSAAGAAITAWEDQ